MKSLFAQPLDALETVEVNPPVTESPTAPESPGNEVSDETGQFDPRFLLWRKFCADQGISVSSLPGDLSVDLKALWEEQKESGFGARRSPPENARK